MSSIRIKDGKLEGKTFDLDPKRELILGRDKKTDIHVPDRKLSRKHCSFEQVPAGLVLSDLKSTNGTFVNGQRITTKILEDGDIIKVGRTEIEFEASGGGAGVIVSGVDVKSSRIRFCSDCGISVPARDIESGKATEAGPRLYCAACAPKHASDGPARGGGGRRRKKGFVPSYSREHRDRTESIPPLSKDELAELLGKVPDAPADEEKVMRSLVSRAVRGRAHQQALDIIVKQKITNIDPKDLAALSGLKAGEVKRVLADWKNAGLVKSLPGAPFRLAPGKSDAEALRTFVRLWAQGQWREKLLGWIRAEEAKGG